MTALPRRICIVGPGRLGLALTSLLRASGRELRIHLVGRREAAPAGTPVGEAGPLVTYGTAPLRGGDAPGAVLLTVPDDAISRIVSDVVRWSLDRATPVLHMSGAYGSEVLEPLSAAGHPVGAVHPLAAISDPETDWTNLRGALFGVEGDPRAVEVAKALAEVARGRTVFVPSASRPAYHAAAVLGSNYVVTLLGRAREILREAGVEGDDLEAGLAHLAAGSVRSTERSGALASLTGPVARGDIATVRRHLARLSPPARRVYSCLGVEALALASARGLDPGIAREIAALFEEGW